MAEKKNTNKGRKTEPGFFSDYGLAAGIVLDKPATKGGKTSAKPSATKKK